MFITSAPILLLLCALPMRTPDTPLQSSGESEEKDLNPRLVKQIKGSGYTFKLFRRRVEFRVGEGVERAIVLWIEAVDVAKKEKRAVWNEYIPAAPLMPGEPRDITMTLRDDKHAAVAYLAMGSIRFPEIDLGKTVDIRPETVTEELKLWSFVAVYPNTARNIPLWLMLRDRKFDYRKVTIKSVLWKQDSWNVIVSFGDTEVTFQRGRDAKAWTVKKTGP